MIKSLSCFVAVVCCVVACCQSSAFGQSASTASTRTLTIEAKCQSIEQQFAILEQQLADLVRRARATTETTVGLVSAQSGFDCQGAAASAVAKTDGEGCCKLASLATKLMGTKVGVAGCGASTGAAAQSDCPTKNAAACASTTIAVSAGGEAGDKIACAKTAVAQACDKAFGDTRVAATAQDCCALKVKSTSTCATSTGVTVGAPASGDGCCKTAAAASCEKSDQKVAAAKDCCATKTAAACATSAVAADKVAVLSCGTGAPGIQTAGSLVAKSAESCQTARTGVAASTSECAKTAGCSFTASGAVAAPAGDCCSKAKVAVSGDAAACTPSACVQPAAAQISCVTLADGTTCHFTIEAPVGAAQAEACGKTTPATTAANTTCLVQLACDSPVVLSAQQCAAAQQSCKAAGQASAPVDCCKAAAKAVSDCCKTSASNAAAACQSMPAGACGTTAIVVMGERCSSTASQQACAQLCAQMCAQMAGCMPAPVAAPAHSVGCCLHGGGAAAVQCAPTSCGGQSASTCAPTRVNLQSACSHMQAQPVRFRVIECCPVHAPVSLLNRFATGHQLSPQPVTAQPAGCCKEAAAKTAAPAPKCSEETPNPVSAPIHGFRVMGRQISFDGCSAGGAPVAQPAKAGACCGALTPR